MKKIIIVFILILSSQNTFSDVTFKKLQENTKTSFLDFVLLKIEQKLIQRHSLLRTQAMPLRVQYQSVASQVDFVEKDSKIIITIVGVMDKKRYSQKKYKPKNSDCNILRNILLYGKYGYNFLFQKRNSYLTNSDMEEIFISRFLNNLSLSENEKNYIMYNTFAKVKVIDPVRGNNFYCSGKVVGELD